MSIETTYSNARAHLAELCDKAVDDRETIIIKRRRGRSVALIAADELSSIMETLHLVRSPNNAMRLFTALEGLKRGEGVTMSIDELKRLVGLEPAEAKQAG